MNENLSFRFFTIFCCLLFAKSEGVLAESTHPKPRLRYPVAMEWLVPGESLITANRRSRSFSIVNIGLNKVVTEIQWEGQLTDMIGFPSSEWFAWTDTENRKVVVGHFQDNQLTEQIHLPVSQDARHLAINPQGTLLAVGSRWAHRIDLFEIHNPSFNSSIQIKPIAIIDLPFAVGRLTFLDDQRLLVADSFAGRLAELNASDPSFQVIHELPANNIGAIHISHSPSTSGVWISSESLNSSATTFRPEVTWGVLMGNHLRHIPLHTFNHAPMDLAALGRVYSLGDETGPGGDPGDIITTADGKILVALTGVDRIAVKSSPDNLTLQRIQVGNRPIALQLSPEEDRVYVANHFSDTVSVVDLQTLEVTNTIPLGTQPELSPAETGERHFYDATFSIRGWFSCHSCHTDGHTTSALNDNFSDDSFGAPKKIPSLLGVLGTEPMAWLGHRETLEEQIQTSLDKTMFSENHDESTITEIAVFLRTLTPPTPLLRAREMVDEARASVGKKTFVDQNCIKCHQAPLYTSTRSYDVGLADEQGNSKFNPPFLQGVSQRDAFFHDARASRLEEVFTVHKHPNGNGVPAKDLDALLYFLQSL